MSKSIHIENLCTGYNGKVILENISLYLYPGQALAIIGQNGCGKSTLLKTIFRMNKENTGSIYTKQGDSVNDLNIKNTWDLRELGVSYFTQEGLVFNTLKVIEHFELVLKDKSKVEAKRIKDECLSYFPALENCMSKRGGNLSGGQRQMLSFAMLLSQQTQFWLLDEPTAGLSPESVKDAVVFLKKMKQNQKSIILVEHNHRVVFELADQVAVIKDGKIFDSFSRLEFQKEEFLNKYLYN